MDVEAVGSEQEEGIRGELLGQHPKWDIRLEQGYRRRWVIRDGAGVLLARHMDIAVAREVAEGRRM